MGAVDIGVGHDDDALVAQIARRDICAPVPQPSACTRSVSSWFCCSLPAPALATFRILPRKRQDGLGRAVARLLGGAAGAVAFDQEDLRAVAAASRVQSASLPGRRSLRVAALREISFSCRLLQPVFGLVDDEVEQLVGFLRAFRQPMVEMIAHHVFDQPLRIGRGELVLGLALEFRLADEDRQHARRRRPSHRRS